MSIMNFVVQRVRPSYQDDERRGLKQYVVKPAALEVNYVSEAKPQTAMIDLIEAKQHLRELMFPGLMATLREIKIDLERARYLGNPCRDGHYVQQAQANLEKIEALFDLKLEDPPENYQRKDDNSPFEKPMPRIFRSHCGDGFQGRRGLFSEVEKMLFEQAEADRVAMKRDLELRNAAKKHMERFINPWPCGAHKIAVEIDQLEGNKWVSTFHITQSGVTTRIGRQELTDLEVEAFRHAKASGMPVVFNEKSTGTASGEAHD